MQYMSTKINNKIDTETFQLLIYSIFAPIDNGQKNSWNCVSNLTDWDGTDVENLLFLLP